MNCRFCKNTLTHEFVDLGFSPPSNSYLKASDLNKPETFFPLRIMVCEKCFLVQIDEFAKHDDIFNADYAYFSSFSTSWLAHAKAYTVMMIKRFGFNSQSQVIEIASNDGYLLQYFKEQGIPVLGIEPTANTAAAAKEKGIESVVDFFGVRLANTLGAKGIKADLLLGNNVLAHVPDINDFVGGLKILLRPDGVITFEFPHLLQLIDKNQFDTIYHEHFSYLSLIAVKQIFERHGLAIFDVEEVATHGGSLRIFVKHADDTKAISDNVAKIMDKEITFGLNDLPIYKNYQDKAEKVKNDFTEFLIKAKKDGKKVAGYGAAAKGNTLLNFAGAKKDLLHFVADASPHKQNKFLPGVHIPVFDEQKIKTEKPDYIVILPWNLKDEISDQLNYIRAWGGKFVVAVPELKIF
ncbi:MAG: class SAM-dependent methyltransferase [Mucilaginibacter sp.]|nr:class SAM-dependent methyltransferase [Mucilaginibacter sp.]